MSIHSLPGVFDILPVDPKELWRCSYLWQHVEKVIRETATAYGYQEIRTPMFERTELFSRSVGENSDIVSKEMYSFDDRGGRSTSLRPEGTAPVMRAFIEHKLQNNPSLNKFFYIGPMFRYERSQAGRYRQHHQFGIEAIGNQSPEQDVEVIDLLYTLYTKLGLTNLRVNINSLGNKESRQNYREALKEYFKPHYEALSEDSKSRFESNPLRILDSKDTNDRQLLEFAPTLLDYLDEESRQNFERVQELLTLLDIPFTVDPKLVRGLDYYNRTVFEVTAQELGAQNSIGGGGRYDGLLKALNGPDLPAIGFGTGIERIIQTMIKQEIPLPSPPGPLLYFIPLGEASSKTCFTLVHNLRHYGLAVDMDSSGRKLGKAMQYADNINARYVAVIGDEELDKEVIKLKDMASGEVNEAPLYNLERILRFETEKENFLSVWNEMHKPFEKQTEADFFVKKLKDSIEQTKDLTSKLQSAVEEMNDLI